MASDKEVIEVLGGPSTLAKKLGGMSAQRVFNWTVRGIPAAVRLKHHAMFAKAEREAERNAQEASTSN